MTAASLSHPTTSQSDRPAEGRGLHIGLWLGQGALALAFFMAGATKLTTPAAELSQMMPVFEGSLVALARFIGAAEILGALGLVLPAATRIRPNLTVLAALGLATVMVLAVGTHAVRGEAGPIVANVILGALAAFVAWGRARKHPIAAR